MSSTNLSAIIYVRVSTGEQVDNYSLDTQEELCRKEAEKTGHFVRAIFREEGKSAKSIIGRPEIVKMLSYCQKNRKKIDAVFVYRLDRIARDVGDYVSIRKKLFDYGIKLISTREPTGDSPSETFMEQVFAAAAQYDNAIRGERAKNGMYARFKSGLPNMAPLGYVMKDGYAVRDIQTFAVVQNSWNLMASGTKTIREITAIAISDGLRIKGRKPQLKNFYRLFRNKFYCGILASTKYNEEVYGQHEPMIIKKMFNSVQLILDGKKAQNIRSLKASRNNEDFPFKRHIVCKYCSRCLSGGWSKGRLKRYPYYFCARRCVGSSINADKLHQTIQNLMKSHPLDQDQKIQIMKLFKVRLRKTRLSAASRQNNISKNISELKEQRSLLTQKHIQGIYSDDIYEEQNQRIQREIDLLEKEFSKLMKYRKNAQSITAEFNELLDSFNVTVERAEIEGQKALLHYLIPAGLISDLNGGLVLSTIKVKKETLDQYRQDAFDALVEMVEKAS